MRSDHVSRGPAVRLGVTEKCIAREGLGRRFAGLAGTAYMLPPNEPPRANLMRYENNISLIGLRFCFRYFFVMLRLISRVPVSSSIFKTSCSFHFKLSAFREHSFFRRGGGPEESL